MAAGPGTVFRTRNNAQTRGPIRVGPSIEWDHCAHACRPNRIACHVDGPDATDAGWIAHHAFAPPDPDPHMGNCRNRRVDHLESIRSLYRSNRYLDQQQHRASWRGHSSDCDRGIRRGVTSPRPSGASSRYSHPPRRCHASARYHRSVAVHVWHVHSVTGANHYPVTGTHHHYPEGV